MPRLQSGGKPIILAASTLLPMCMHVYSRVYSCVHVCVHVCVHSCMCACVLACVIVSILGNSTFTYLHLVLGSMHMGIILSSMHMRIMGSMHIGIMHPCVCIMHICACMHARVYTSLDHDMFLLTHAKMRQTCGRDAGEMQAHRRTSQML